LLAGADRARPGQFTSGERDELRLPRGGCESSSRSAVGVPSIRSPDLVKRDVAAERPDTLWVTDSTQIQTWHQSDQGSH